MSHIFTGKVVHGDGYGRKIGFPTVNLHIEDVGELPPGVYSGSVILEHTEYRAGVVIGPHSKVEAHLIGYSGDAYGLEVTLKINKFLRKYEKFETERELIDQITKDISQC